MKKNKSISITIVCLILGLILSWQYKSIYDNKQLETTNSKRLEDFKDELLMEKNNNDNLRKRNEELVQQMREFENARGNINTYEENLKKELERARIIAGLVDVRGSGINIVLDNNMEFANSEFAGYEWGRVTENVLLTVINELRAADAQAISVNDERIVAMSEIREAGVYININGVRMQAPYTIKAIANPDKIESALKMLGGLMERLKDLKVSIEKKNDIIIPKVRDDGTVIKTNLITPVNK